MHIYGFYRKVIFHVANMNNMPFINKFKIAVNQIVNAQKTK